MTHTGRGVALWMLLAGVPALAACNMVTGAGDWELADDDDGDSSSASGSATSGVGGATSSGQQAATTASGTGGATTAATTGSTTATTGSGTSGAGAGPGACEYPQGPYGVGQGQIVPPTITWQGFVPGSSTPSTISMQDFFDCDGSGGVDAIIIDTSQYG